MDISERWWRVIALNGKTTWTDEDPSDRLTAAWEHATVRGPFVLEAASTGAVSKVSRAQGLAEALASAPDTATIEGVRAVGAEIASLLADVRGQ